MSLVGDKRIFAIEWTIKEKIDEYFYGYFCFWIGGKLVGNFDEISTISICSSYLRDFLSDKSARLFEGSEILNANDVYFRIYGRFFSGTSIGSQEYLELSKYRVRYWLDEIGEYSFRDKLGIFIIDEPVMNRQRFVWKTFIDGNITQFFLSLGYFESVANEFLHEVSKQKMNFINKDNN